MFCPEARNICCDGVVTVGSVTDTCLYWSGGACQRKSYYDSLVERTKGFAQLADMQKALLEGLFEDIENSDAPESVKTYIREYHNKVQAEKLIKDSGLSERRDSDGQTSR